MPGAASNATATTSAATIGQSDLFLSLLIPSVYRRSSPRGYNLSMRRRFQFPLRYLFILIMAVAYLCALGKVVVERHQEESRLRELEADFNYLFRPLDR